MGCSGKAMVRAGIKALAVIVIFGDSHTVHAQDGWDFRLTPYLWFAGLKGDVATIPGLPTVPIDVSPSDALQDTETGFMSLFEAKKNGKGLFIDAIYTDVRSTEDLVPAINLTLKSTSKTTMISGAYLQEFYNEGGTVADWFAGMRYWNIDSNLAFGGGLGLLAGSSVSHDESWWDPILGVKGRTLLGASQWYLAGGGVIGGFGIGSDFLWDLSANLGYQWNKAIGTTLGYRVYDLDYEDNGFIYDVQQAGMSLGLTWAF
jgi:hypothetical protein